MDNVLADTEPIYMSITRDLLAELGVRLSPEQLFSYVGIPADRVCMGKVKRLVAGSSFL